MSRERERIPKQKESPNGDKSILEIGNQEIINPPSNPLKP